MSKFYSRPDLIAQRALWRAEGKKVVFTNGCYDILHPGHVRLLEAARSLGDVLILALNTDDSV
jgi:bifunctional ADP-heptose synthase (sugar kinase/adenylyltransferase)